MSEKIMDLQMPESEKSLLQKMVGLANLPQQTMSVCSLAKYVFGAKRPELSKMSPADINKITAWSEGADNSREILIKLTSAAKNIVSVTGKTITSVSNLAELRDWLNKQTTADINDYIDMPGLPVFGTDEPVATENIWSWDDKSFLVFDEGKTRRYILIPRRKFIKYTLMGCSGDVCDNCERLPAEWKAVAENKFYCDDCLPSFAEKICDVRKAMQALRGGK